MIIDSQVTGDILMALIGVIAVVGLIGTVGAFWSLGRQSSYKD